MNNKRWDWRLAWWGSTEKKVASHFLGFRGRQQYSDQRSSRIRSPRAVFTAAGTETWEDQMARSSAYIEQLTEEAGRSLMKKEKSTGPRTDLCGTSQRARAEATSVILKKHASLLIRKERWSPTNKASREASRNKFVKRSGVPDRVESFGEVEGSKKRP